MKYSVVLPIKNEESNLPQLLKELRETFSTITDPWEILAIDDGSDDSSLSVLKDWQAQLPELRILCMDRNYGQSSAFDAGFKAALGEFVITLDADLQNDPRDIPTLIEEQKQGSDLVCGWRKKRQDSPFKKFLSKVANLVRGRLCDDGVHDTCCSLKLMRRDCLKGIKLFHGAHRFLPALFKMEGYRVSEVPVNHRPRTQGVSKYHFFNRSLGPTCDLFGMLWLYRRRLKYQMKK